MISLYHGSSEKITEITDQGIFGGLFCHSDDVVCKSHGDCLHVIELADDEVLTQSFLEYHADYETVKSVVAEFTNCESEEDEEIAWAIVVEEKSAHDYDEDTACRILGGLDSGEASWNAQRIRGKIAKALGFVAVEMDDEHGTSYLVLPGANIKAM